MQTFSLHMVPLYGDTAILTHIVSQQNKCGVLLLAFLRIHNQRLQPKEGIEILW